MMRSLSGYINHRRCYIVIAVIMFQAYDTGKLELPLTLTNALTHVEGNVISHFKTRYKPPLRFHGQWEIGLTSICFSNNINNIPYEDSGLVKLKIVVVERSSSSTLQKINSKHLELGNYRTIDALVRDILMLWKHMRVARGKPRLDLADIIKFEHNPATNKLTMKGLNHVRYKLSELSLEFSPQLCAILGLDSNQPIASFEGQNFTFPRTVDVNAGVYYMYVLCDQVEHSYVGDRSAPLLRVVPLAGQKQEGFRHIQFNDIQWRRLTHEELPEIEIKLHEDLSGNRIKFMHGGEPVVINVKLRKVGGS